MRLRPLKDGDLDFLFYTLRDPDKHAIDRMGGRESCRKAVEEMVQYFPSQVIESDDGAIAALAIALRKWDGVVEIVAYTTTAVERNPIGFHKACIRGMAFAQEVLQLHKVECIVWEGYMRSVRWLERLGFSREGLLLAHGPDKSNAIAMGRVF